VNLATLYTADWQVLWDAQMKSVRQGSTELGTCAPDNPSLPTGGVQTHDATTLCCLPD
jgi:hypothetical protein